MVAAVAGAAYRDDESGSSELGEMALRGGVGDGNEALVISAVERWSNGQQAKEPRLAGRQSARDVHVHGMKVVGDCTRRDT